MLGKAHRCVDAAAGGADAGEYSDFLRRLGGLRQCQSSAESGMLLFGSVKGMLSVRVDRPAKDVVVIAVAGEVDSVTAPRLSTSLHRELEGRPAVLILDLTAVSFLGVAGLHVLGCALDRSKTLSVALSVVHHEESPVQSALRAAAMTGDFPTFRTVTQARTSSGPVPTTR